MEMTLNNGFYEMTVDETQNIEGGFIIALIAVGSATITITSGQVTAAVVGAWTVGQIVGGVKKAFF